MTLFGLMLGLHIFLGCICLVSGFVAMVSRKRKGTHTTWGEVYHIVYVGIAATAIVLAVMRWSQIAFLFYVACFSYALALYGYLAKKQKWKNGIKHHIRGMCGSYIGAITALLVNVMPNVPWINTLYPHVLNWFLPTIIGTPLIYFGANKYFKSLKKTKSAHSKMF